MARVFKLVGDKFQWTDVPNEEAGALPAPSHSSNKDSRAKGSQSNEASERVSLTPKPFLGSRSNEAVAERKATLQATPVVAPKLIPITVPTPITTPTPAITSKPIPEPEKQGFGSAILSAITTLARNFVNRTELQGIINTNVPSELRMVGNLAGTGTKYLQLPSGYATAVWGPGGGGGSMPCSGRVWVGNKNTFTVDLGEVGATRFLYIKNDGSGYSWAGSMPTAQPADGVVFDLDQTAGDIHIVGSIAPGG